MMFRTALLPLLALAACASDPPLPAPADAPRSTTDTSNWERAPTPSAAALRGGGSGFTGGGTQQLPARSATGRRISR